MSASVFLLMGFMGTGKLTIAQEIKRTMRDASQVLAHAASIDPF